jgi:signal transduction histidine kinase
MNKPYLSLFTKIALSLTILFMTAIISSGYLMMLNYHNDLLLEKNKLAFASAKTLAIGSIDSIISEDYEFLEGWLNAVVLTDIYAYGYLSKANGHILVHTDLDKIASYRATLLPFPLHTSRQLLYKNRLVNEIIYSAQIGNKVFAYAHIAYFIDQPIFSNFTSQHFYIVFIAMIIFLILILMATLFIIRKHTEPIRQLSSIIEHFCFNNNTLFIPKQILEQPDEIGMLANHFKQMTQRLTKIYDELNNEKVSLQSKVAQRTQTLQKQNTLLADMQDKLVESEKMVSLGALVAGIAHEINTPIGICLTSISLINDHNKMISEQYQSQQLSEEDLAYYLDLSHKSAHLALDNIHKIVKLITLFKSLSIDQENDDAQCFNLYQHLYDCIHILSTHDLNRYHIKIIGDNQLTIQSDQKIFFDIINHLISNSLIHAFANQASGKITIQFLIKKEQLILHYNDNGCGIPIDILNKLFDPFITSKRGEGCSGLGTHIVYNLVVQKLKGTIQCHSQLNKGTTFDITIPIICCSLIT